MCALCGDRSRPLSFHMIEFTAPGRAVPDGGVAMAQRSQRSNDVTTRGSFPICTSCAPPCAKCGLPVPSDRQQEFLAAITRGAGACTITSGLGVCEHIKWSLFARAVVKRTLKLGRFATNPPARALSLVSGLEDEPRRPRARLLTPPAPEDAEPIPTGDRTTIWMPLKPDHPVLAAAGVTAITHIPVFVDGPAFREFEKTRTVDVTPRALMFGAVLHAREDAPGVDPLPFRQHLPRLLEVLAQGFSEASVEDLMTHAAATLRVEHGGALSRRALENAVKLFPMFHRARSDLIVDLWLAALRGPSSERQEVLVAMLAAFGKLNRSHLRAGPRAFVCYAAVAGTALTKGLDAARELSLELNSEIKAGDEGELRVKLEAFLAKDGADLSQLQVSLS